MAVNSNLPLAAIANYFVARAAEENMRLDGQKLQKLLYLAYAWHLGYFTVPLMRKQPVFTKYGPMFRGAKTTGCDLFARRWLLRLSALLHPLKDQTKHLLDEIWINFRGFTGPQLSVHCRQFALPQEYIKLYMALENANKDIAIDDSVIAASFAVVIHQRHLADCVPKVSNDGRVVDMASFRARKRRHTKSSSE